MNDRTMLRCSCAHKVVAKHAKANGNRTMTVSPTQKTRPPATRNRRKVMQITPELLPPSRAAWRVLPCRLTCRRRRRGRRQPMALQRRRQQRAVLLRRRQLPLQRRHLQGDESPQEHKLVNAASLIDLLRRSLLVTVANSSPYQQTAHHNSEQLITTASSFPQHTCALRPALTPFSFANWRLASS